MSSDHEAEIRASVGAHYDLGSRYDDAVAEGLVERIGAEIDKRIDARLGQLGTRAGAGSPPGSQAGPGVPGSAAGPATPPALTVPLWPAAQPGAVVSPVAPGPPTAPVPPVAPVPPGASVPPVAFVPPVASVPPGSAAAPGTSVPPGSAAAPGYQGYQMPPGYPASGYQGHPGYPGYPWHQGYQAYQAPAPPGYQVPAPRATPPAPAAHRSVAFTVTALGSIALGVAGTAVVSRFPYPGPQAIMVALIWAAIAVINIVYARRR